jgi:predicted DNA-binding WGR domain protein
MPDDLRSPIKHHLVLHRIDPEQGIRRFYSLMIERDLFGTVRLVRNWGRIGNNRQALEAVARVKRRRGYRDL